MAKLHAVYTTTGQGNVPVLCRYFIVDDTEAVLDHVMLSSNPDIDVSSLLSEGQWLALEGRCQLEVTGTTSPWFVTDEAI